MNHRIVMNTRTGGTITANQHIVMAQTFMFVSMDKRLLYPLAFIFFAALGFSIWYASTRAHALRVERQAQIDRETKEGYRGAP